MIPSTPTNPKPPTLPVRYVGILRQASEVGSYHTTNAVSDRYLLGDMRHYDIYTILPPHLAEQWAELRKKKAEAERTLMQNADKGAIYYMEKLYQDWLKALNALAAFEKQHGIGGAE